MELEIRELEIEAGPVEKKRGLKKISEYILLGLVFLLPLFFIPSTSFPFQFNKIILFSIGVLAVFSVWLFDALSKRRFRLPTGMIFYASIAILAFSLLSSLFSETVWKSVIGIGSESETFFLLLMLFLSMFLSYSFVRENNKVFGIYKFLSISALIVFLYQILRLIIGPDFLSFGILTSAASNLLGKWNDLGVFFGLVLLLSMMKLMFLKEEKTNKWFTWGMLVLSALFVAIINSLLVWIVIGVFALMALIYEISFSQDEEEINISSLKLPILVIGIAIVFIFARSIIGGLVTETLEVNQIEIRPSWGATIDLAGEGLSNSPILGAGPNQFSTVWNQSKPLAVNSTPFWNVNFNFAIGFIPTTIITQGILGFISWLVLLVGIVLLGLKALLAANSVRGPDKFVILSSLITTLYLWTFMVIYLPGVVMIMLTFLLSGVFLGVMAYMNLIGEKNITFGRDSITSFASALVISLLLLVNITLIYSIGVRYLSAVYFQKSLIEINTNGDVEGGERNARRALSLNANDRNYRLISNIEILKINSLVGDVNNLSDNETRANFQNLLGSAIQNAQLATLSDGTNYQNWISLGSIYESIIPLGIEGSYENAVESYIRAQVENPTNPEIDLILARTEVANGDREKAREHIRDALTKKNNYTQAVFLLSQIEIADGNINEAIRSSEAATLISPNDPTLFFQLGFLRYNQRNYQGAVEPLERAVGLNPTYSNAKYFLGLSYYNLGRSTEAIAQFGDLETLNPENNEVKIILSNMRQGLNAFAGLEVENPAERDTLPVEEES